MTTSHATSSTPRSVRHLVGAPSNAPTHLALSGDNLEALAHLEHAGDLVAGTVDVVYLDPPAHLDTAFDRYADDFAIAGEQDGEDWVDLMRPRVKAAHRLLNLLGVLIVSIGDQEHHRLRLLLDEVFGPSNFIDNLTWATTAGRASDSRWIASTCEHLPVYARDTVRLKASGIRWREPKEGVQEILDKAADLFRAAHGDPAVAELAFKAWRSGLPTDHLARSKAFVDYDKIDAHGDLYRHGSLAKAQKGQHHYDLVDPNTGTVANQPSNGWRMPEEQAAEMIAAGEIVFSADGLQAHSVMWLREQATQAPGNLFASPRGRGAAHLKAVLGQDRFPDAQDHEVLMRWLGLAAPADATVVDLFGGSGSTAEAVLRLNVADSGTRRFILITTNDVPEADRCSLTRAGHEPGQEGWEARGVFERVTVPRLRALLTGARPDGSSYAATVTGAVEVRVLG